MIRFCVGCSATFAALFVTTVVWAQLRGLLAAEECIALGLALLGWPVLSATAAAAFINTRRPRLVFDRRAGRRLKPVVLGALTGLLCISIAAILLVWIDRFASDELVFAGSAALAALAVVGPLRTSRPGACIACGYDIRASIGFGRCPECGLQIAG